MVVPVGAEVGAWVSLTGALTVSTCGGSGAVEAVGSVVPVGFGVLVLGVFDVSVVVVPLESSALGGSAFAPEAAAWFDGAWFDVAASDPDFCGSDCWDVAPFVPDSFPDADGLSSARATPPAIPMTA